MTVSLKKKISTGVFLVTVSGNLTGIFSSLHNKTRLSNLQINGELQDMSTNGKAHEPKNLQVDKNIFNNTYSTIIKLDDANTD